MPTALDKMMGRGGPQIQHIEGEAKAKPSMQDNLALSLLQKMIPGFDPRMIENLGNDLAQTVQYFKTKVDDQERRTLLIMKHLGIEDEPSPPSE